jgi:hypothetical protein
MYNAKPKFAKLLRTKNIRYQTFPNFIVIGTVTLTFNPDEETVTFRDARMSYISLRSHLTTPCLILVKLYEFIQMLTNFKCGAGIFNHELHKN